MLYLSKRPKINVHEHIQNGFDFKRYISVMDTYNIEKVFLLATGTQKGNEGYEVHQKYLAKVRDEFPERVEMFVTVAHLRDDCLKQFERGLKYKPIGLKLMSGHPEMSDIPLNDKRIYPLFKRCHKEGMMALLHWQLNIKEENWEILRDTLETYPKVVFLLAHLGVGQGNFSKLAELLNKYDNLFLDCSWGGYFKYFVREVDWEPEKFRNFYTEYSDRIAWGTDQVMSRNTSNQLLWQHSTEIEVLEQSKYRGWQKYFSKREAFGLGLDNNTLNKIFYDTPKAILEKIGR